MDIQPDAQQPVVPRRRKSSGIGMVIIATCLPTVVTAAVWYWFIRDQPGSRPAGNPRRPTNSLPVASTSSGPRGNPSSVASTQSRKAVASTAPLEPLTGPAGDRNTRSPGVSSQDGSGSILPEVQPAGELSDGTAQSPLPIQPVFTQPPVPDDEALEAARNTIRELLREKFSEAKTPAAKHALAHELYQQGIETDDNPAARYVLLQAAIDLAVEVGDFSSALRTIGDISSVFAADRIDMALDVIQEASGNVRLPSEAARLTEACLTLSEYALEDSRFEVAALAVRIAGTNAARSKIPGLTLGVTQTKLRVAAREAAWKLVESARATLQSEPEDPAAHEQLGLWLCFVQKDWPHGLEHLIHSDDELLLDAVSGELLDPPGTEDRTKLAEAWLRAAESRDGLIQNRFQLRARHWLNLASHLMSGLTALQIQDRIDKLDTQALGSERTWLSVLQPIESKLHKTWKLGIGHVGVKQEAIVVRGQEYIRGLGMHPRKDRSSMVRYVLDSKYRTLVAPCAIAGPGPRGEIQFSVIGDDRLLWWSRRVNRTDIVQTCNVDVRGVRVLELRIAVQGDTWGAHTCWLDPFLLKSTPPKGLELP